MRPNGGNAGSHIVDRSLGVAVTVTGTIAVAYALKWLHDSLKRANNTRRLKADEASAMFASLGNMSTNDTAATEATTTLPSAAERYGDENMVVHLGCCHCQRVQFKIFGPKVLNAVDISSKLRFPRISIVYEDFELLCDPSILSMYTVQQPTSIDIHNASSSGNGTAADQQQQQQQQSSGHQHANTNPQVGIYTFCSFCGMHIIYAPSIDPIEVQINVDCLAADNIEQVHIAYHTVNDMVAANQIMDRRGVGVTVSPMLPLFLHRQPKRSVLNSNNNGLEDLTGGLSPPVSSYSMRHPADEAVKGESGRIISNQVNHNTYPQQQQLSAEDYEMSNERDVHHHYSKDSHHVRDSNRSTARLTSMQHQQPMHDVYYPHHLGGQLPQQHQQQHYSFPPVRTSPYQEGLVEGDESILSLTSSTMDLDSATTGLGSSNHVVHHQSHHINNHGHSHSNSNGNNLKKDPSLAPSPSSGAYSYGFNTAATATYYPAPTQHILQRVHHQNHHRHPASHHPQQVRSYGDFYTQYYGDILPPNDLVASSLTPPTAAAATVSTTMILDAEYDPDGDRYSVPSPVPSDSGESSNNTKEHVYHNYGYAYGRNSVSRRSSSGSRQSFSSPSHMLQTPVLVSNSRSSSAATSPLNQQYGHGHWMNSPSPGPSPSHSHSHNHNGKVHAKSNVSPKPQNQANSIATNGRSHTGSVASNNGNGTQGSGKQKNKFLQSVAASSPSSVTSSSPYYPAHMILPVSSASADPQLSEMDPNQMTAYHQKLKRHLNRHAKNEMANDQSHTTNGADIPVVATAVEVASTTGSVLGRDSVISEKQSESIEV